MSKFYVQSHENYNGKLEPDLGISMLNIAVIDAPYRTGNLRSAIALQHNGPKVKRIWYDDYNAFYLKYLEEGQGRVKKHKGFIEYETVGDILIEVMSYIATGEVTYTGMPVIYLRSDRARNYERQLLQERNISIDKRLSASDRARLSRQRFRDKNASSKGLYSRNMVRPEVRYTSRDKLNTVYGKIVEVGGNND